MHHIDELIYQKRNDSYLNISSPSTCSTHSYVRSTPDSLAPIPSPSSQLSTYDTLPPTPDTVRYASTPSPLSQMLPNTVYQVADAYGEYTIVQPHYSRPKFVTAPSTCSTSTQKVRIISNDIVSQALTLSSIQE